MLCQKLGNIQEFISVNNFIKFMLVSCTSHLSEVLLKKNYIINGQFCKKFMHIFLAYYFVSVKFSQLFDND